ncbi:MAG: C1 family peptidase [Thermoplasmatota archaeon]
MISCTALLIVSTTLTGLNISLNTRDIQEQKNDITYVDSDGETSLDNLYPAMCEPIHVSELRTRDDYTQVALVDTPAAFSWKNYQGTDLTTPARSQGQCGSCWAFAAIGTIESLINIKENCLDIDMDLSEQYLLSCVPASGSCNGGHSASPFSFIMNTSEDGNFCNGVISEECLRYQADDSVPCSQKTQNWMETLVPLSGFGEVYFGQDNPEAVATMKSQIFQNGPIYGLIYVDNDFRWWGSLFHRSTDVYRYRNFDEIILNHGIVIVGWQDDASLRSGGYWICKNSWGTTWGYDGFFNIEYGSMNINYYMAWPEYDPDSFNCPPVTDAGGLYRGDVGDPVRLDGSKCVDPEGEPVHYSWDFGDGTVIEEMSPAHVFPQPGTYQVTLTVTDVANKTATDYAIVCIGHEDVTLYVSGGLGLNIDIGNPFDVDITDTVVSIDIDGALQNMDYKSEVIEVIPAHGTVTLALPVVGLGRGTVHIRYENIDVTQNFYALGPFVLAR